MGQNLGYNAFLADNQLYNGVNGNMYSQAGGKLSSAEMQQVQESYNNTPISDLRGLGSQGGGHNWTGQGGYLQTGSQVMQGLGALAGAYTGYKALGLAKDQFAFTKVAANRDIANQGQIINNQYENANNVGLALAGNNMTSAQKEASRTKTKNRFVNTSAIG